MPNHRTRSATLLPLIAFLLGCSASAVAAQPLPAALPLPPAASTLPAAQSSADDVQAQPLDEPSAPHAPAMRLSSYEQDVLNRGGISPGAYIVGGLLGTWIGFGLGHAVQGRYDDGGIIFMFGEATGLTFMFMGLINTVGNTRCLEGPAIDGEFNNDVVCKDEQRNETLWTGLLVGGAVMFAIIRAYQIVDLWHGPMRHNAEYQRVRRKAQQGGWSSLSIVPVVLPNGDKMAMAGVRF